MNVEKKIIQMGIKYVTQCVVEEDLDDSASLFEGWGGEIRFALSDVIRGVFFNVRHSIVQPIVRNCNLFYYLEVK